MCRDVFNEADFGETDHRTVLQLQPNDAEQLPNCQQEKSESQDKVAAPQERDRPKRQTTESNWYGDTSSLCVYKWYGDTVAHCVLMADDCEPETMSEAMKAPDADAWKAATEAQSWGLWLKTVRGSSCPCHQGRRLLGVVGFSRSSGRKTGLWIGTSVAL